MYEGEEFIPQNYKVNDPSDLCRTYSGASDHSAFILLDNQWYRLHTKLHTSNTSSYDLDKNVMECYARVFQYAPINDPGQGGVCAPWVGRGG